MAVYDPPAFGALLRRYRVAAGLTQEELAERAHVSARTISDLERGARSIPRKDTRELLADGLDLSPADRGRLEAVAHAARASGVSASEAPVEGSQQTRSSTGHRAWGRTARTPELPAPRRRRPMGATIGAAGSLIAAIVALLVFSQVFSGRFSSMFVAGPARGSFATWGWMTVPGMARPGSSSTSLHRFARAERFVDPTRAAVDRWGNVYISEGNSLASFAPLSLIGRSDIVKLSPSGRVLARLGKVGSRPGELNQPAGMAVDKDGNIYVADFGNNRIQKLSPAGKLLAVWGSTGSKPGQFNLPISVALDRQGNLYVADYEQPYPEALPTRKAPGRVGRLRRRVWADL